MTTDRAIQILANNPEAFAALQAQQLRQQSAQGQANVARDMQTLNAGQIIPRILLGIGTGGISELAIRGANLQKQREQELADLLGQATAGVASAPLRPGQEGPPAQPLSQERQIFELARLRALGVPGAETAFQDIVQGQISPQEERGFGLQERGVKVQERQQTRLERQAAREERAQKRREKLTSQLLKDLDRSVVDTQNIGQQQDRSNIQVLQKRNSDLRTLLLDPSLKDFAQAELESNNAQIKQIRDFNKNRNVATNSFIATLGKTDRVLQTIERAKPLVTAGTAGFASLKAVVPGTEAKDLSALVDTIRANIGFDQLQAMRDASPTGGALGQVSEREIAFLQSVLANLEISQSPQQLLQNLSVVEQEINNSLQRIANAYEQDFGVLPPGFEERLQEDQQQEQPPQQPQRIRFDAQGNIVQQ